MMLLSHQNTRLCRTTFLHVLLYSRSMTIAPNETMCQAATQFSGILMTEEPWSQMIWNESDSLCNQLFESNRYAKTGKVARRCIHCGRDIQEHRSEAVPCQEVLKAIEADSSWPSTILVPSENEGGLYLGACSAAMNHKFLSQAKVGMVINAANLSLDQQYPIFGHFVLEEYPQLGMERLVLGWKDTCDQRIDFVQLKQICEKLHEYRLKGKSVYVHCAQGRSRSTTVVVAYLCWMHGASVDVALQTVQRKRQMAQPNEGFQEQLRKHDFLV